MAVVTGASRGLGRAVVESFLERDIQVIGIARGYRESCEQRYRHIQADLSDLQHVSRVTDLLVEEIRTLQPTTIYVVHNASIIDPIERVGHQDADLISAAFHVNVLAPMLMTNELMRQLAEQGVQLVIVNVTSGAAERPISGWSVYNSTKAAINMHTQVAGLEQNNSGSGHIVIAFSPGVMDTDMQETIRSAGEKAFRDVAQFRHYKESGNLRSPEEVGETLVKLICKSQLENGRIYSVKELL